MLFHLDNKIGEQVRQQAVIDRWENDIKITCAQKGYYSYY